MSTPDKDPNQYRQLALLVSIMSEIAFAPGILGVLAYFLTQGKSFQTTATIIAAMVGLGVGFYRIYLLTQKWDKDDGNDSK